MTVGWISDILSKYISNCTRFGVCVCMCVHPTGKSLNSPSKRHTEKETIHHNVDGSEIRLCLGFVYCLDKFLFFDGTLPKTNIADENRQGTKK